VVEIQTAHKPDRVGRKNAGLKARDDNEQSHEHQQQRPINLSVYLLALIERVNKSSAPPTIATLATDCPAKNRTIMAAVTNTDLKTRKRWTLVGASGVREGARLSEIRADR